VEHWGDVESKSHNLSQDLPLKFWINRIKYIMGKTLQFCIHVASRNSVLIGRKKKEKKKKGKREKRE